MTFKGSIQNEWWEMHGFTFWCIPLGELKKRFLSFACVLYVYLICVPYMCTHFSMFFLYDDARFTFAHHRLTFLLLFFLARKQASLSLRVTIYHESNLMTLVLLLSQLQLVLFRLTLAVSNPLHQRQNIFTLIFTFLLIIKIKRWFFFPCFLSCP